MKETNKIYVDLESLLDIRQALLMEFLPEDKTAQIVSSEQFNFRTVDDFNQIDMDSYSAKLFNGELSILRKATVTYIVNLVRTRVTSNEKLNNYTSESKEPEIILNTYPFKLPNGALDALINGLFVKLNTPCIITPVYLKPEECTPYMFSSGSYISVFIYDSSAWLNHNADALIKVADTKPNYYFPSLYYNKDVSTEVFKQLGFKDIFSYGEYIFSPVAKISFLPTMFYTNILVSELIADKFNLHIKNKPIEEVKEELYGDSSTEV